jgi:hypothetical protein
VLGAVPEIHHRPGWFSLWIVDLIPAPTDDRSGSYLREYHISANRCATNLLYSAFALGKDLQFAALAINGLVIALVRVRLQLATPRLRTQ